MPRRIAVFTSNRSEYGLLQPVLRRLAGDPGFELALLAGGSHLLPAYGRTIDRIREDGFAVRAEFPFLSGEPGPDAEARALSALTAQLGAHFASDRPDLMMVLGDRYELLAAASAALVMGIPIAHISGGDVTEGAMDNQVRHALTKLAHLHFPATEAAKRNLLRMGEEEWRICVSGEPGLDGILASERVPRGDLWRELGLPPGQDVIVATFHPETLGGSVTPAFVRAAAEALLAAGDHTLLFTGANFDPGGDAINACLADMASRDPRIAYFPSLGQRRYYALLRHAILMVGNSSSGLTEAQSFGLPALDVGSRQQGRLANANVIRVAADPAAIAAALPKALSEGFRASIRPGENLYGDGHAADRIAGFLMAADFPRLAFKRSVFGP